MTALTDLDAGATVYEAAVYYDDYDNPIAREGPSSYEHSEQAAEAFALTALRERDGEPPGGFWYATIRRGRVVDPIGDGHPTTTPSSRTPTGRARSWPRTTSERATAGADRAAPGLA